MLLRNVLSAAPRTNHDSSDRDVEVVNASVSGETTAGGRGRLDAALKRHEPDVVVLKQHKPLPLRLTARLDDGLYALGLPHVLSVLGAGAAAGLVLGLSRAGEGRRIR